jgi:hypothetical protein
MQECIHAGNEQQRARKKIMLAEACTSMWTRHHLQRQPEVQMPKLSGRRCEWTCNIQPGILLGSTTKHARDRHRNLGFVSQSSGYFGQTRPRQDE